VSRPERSPERGKRVRRSFTTEQKRADIAAQASSGLTVAAFCREQKLHQARFRAWREELGAGSDKVFDDLGGSREPILSLPYTLGSAL
jgi:transposase-like protein